MQLLLPVKQALRQRATAGCFNQTLMKGFDSNTFTRRQPFPWYNFNALITPRTFRKLYNEFPPLAAFEKHEGMARKHGQRPHDRYYLAYEETIYTKLKRKAEQGIIHHEQLSPTWQLFMEALLGDPGYRRFIGKLLGAETFVTRFAWHVATAGHSVSPHVDAVNKLGTHIFYFNTSDDWCAEWGGSTLILDDKDYVGMNPEVSHFGQSEAVEIMDNRSFLFKNQPEAWHAVDTITCPPGVHRRIFNVIFEVPKLDAEPAKATVSS